MSLSKMRTSQELDEELARIKTADEQRAIRFVRLQAEQDESDRKRKELIEAAEERAFEEASEADQLTFNNNVSAQLVAGLVKKAKSLPKIAEIAKSVASGSPSQDEEDSFASLYVSQASGNRREFLRSLADLFLASFELQKTKTGAVSPSPTSNETTIVEIENPAPLPRTPQSLPRPEKAQEHIQNNLTDTMAESGLPRITEVLQTTPPLNVQEQVLLGEEGKNENRTTIPIPDQGSVVHPFNGEAPPFQIQPVGEVTNTGPGGLVQPEAPVPDRGRSVVKGPSGQKRKRDETQDSLVSIDTTTTASTMYRNGPSKKDRPAKDPNTIAARVNKFIVHLRNIANTNGVEAVEAEFNCTHPDCDLEPPKNPRLAKCLHLYCQKCPSRLHKGNQERKPGSAPCADAGCKAELGRSVVVDENAMTKMLETRDELINAAAKNGRDGD